jgi:hypothetical protein
MRGCPVSLSKTVPRKLEKGTAMFMKHNAVQTFYEETESSIFFITISVQGPGI